MKLNRFKEVVGGVVDLFEKQPLNDAEIIQLGELALKAIDRDQTIKDFTILILTRLAVAYETTEKHAEAKDAYIKLYKKSGKWSDFLGLVNSLANAGEIEELNQTIKKISNNLIANKRTHHLKELKLLLEKVGALAELRKTLAFNIACLEGDVASAVENSLPGEIYPEYFIKDSAWETNREHAEDLANVFLDLNMIEDRLFVKKIYLCLLNQEPSSKILEAVLKYYVQTKSKHIGYFFKENSGVKVEMSSEKWVEAAFRKCLKISKPEEIDIELDTGADLFEVREGTEDHSFKKIRLIENRISFLLKNKQKEEAKKFYVELKALDPSNEKFEKEFSAHEDSVSSQSVQHENWQKAWSTLNEISAYAGVADERITELKISLKNIDTLELQKNYREYVYALIAAGDELECLRLLDNILDISPNEFKEISYLKARCYLNIGRSREVIGVVDSVLESTVLASDELIEFLYTKAMALELCESNKEALSVYKIIFKHDPKYRMVGLKISKLEQE